MGTSFKLLLGLLLAPALAFGMVSVTAPGGTVSIGRPSIIVTAPAYDSDALAYFARAGVTDPTAKQNISDFVKGVKTLGLWNSMVCWPLRSSQNAGSGTTAYSLGGLGTYNGTLVNGPTWGASGITTTTSNQSITTTFNFPGAVNSLLSVLTPATTTSGNRYIGNDQAATSNGLGFDAATANQFRRIAASVTNFGTRAASVSMVGVGAGTGNGWMAQDGTYTASAVGYNASTNTIRVMGGAGGAVGTEPHTCSFAIVIAGAITSGDWASLRDLYKTTLGQGLGLP